MATFTKCATTTRADDPIVLHLLDETDPNDLKTLWRENVAAFWKDASDTARRRYQAAEADARREAAVRHVREALLDRALRAAGSHGAGNFVPLTQIFRVRGGLELPL